MAWPTRAAIDEDARAAIGDAREVGAALARSPVPVLAPKAFRLERPTLVVEGEYFALTGRVGGATISLQGTRAAHRYEGIEPAAGDREVRGGRGFVSVNEGIRTVSWMENGAAYSLDVECAEATDARCASDTFALEVAEGLTYVGGSER